MPDDNDGNKHKEPKTPWQIPVGPPSASVGGRVGSPLKNISRSRPHLRLIPPNPDTQTPKDEEQAWVADKIRGIIGRLEHAQSGVQLVDLLKSELQSVEESHKKRHPILTHHL